MEHQSVSSLEELENKFLAQRKQELGRDLTNGEIIACYFDAQIIMDIMKKISSGE